MLLNVEIREFDHLNVEPLWSNCFFSGYLFIYFYCSFPPVFPSCNLTVLRLRQVPVNCAQTPEFFLPAFVELAISRRKERNESTNVKTLSLLHPSCPVAERYLPSPDSEAQDWRASTVWHHQNPSSVLSSPKPDYFSAVCP